MILLGQYDSPFVRRVAVALHHHGHPFEREVLSVFADFDAVLARNPLGKVPALRLDTGEWLVESRAIVEWLDAGAAPDRRLTCEAADLPAMLRIEAVAIGLAEKTYERGIEVGRRGPGRADPAMIARQERQIAGALAWLEGALGDGFAVGGRLGRADLALACATTYLRAKQPGLWDAARTPRLARHNRLCEDLAPFRAAPYSASEAAASGWRPET